MAIALRYAARSDIGLGRYKENQDSGYAGPHLLVVADGMGGNAGGDVASSLAVGRLAALDGESHGADALQHLEHAVRGAAVAVRDRAREQPELSGMATTVTALLRSGDRLALAHIGDSRAYLLHDGQVTQVTSDHTFVQRLVDEGRITAEEAERHPQGNIVMRMLGDIDGNDDIDASVRTAAVGDRWLLCSDGLSGFVSLDTIAETLRDVPDPGECADLLVQLALRGGGADNITAIVADVVDAGSAPATNPQVVGAAARERQRQTSAAPTTAAAKAAALTRAAEDDDDEDDLRDDDLRPSRGTIARRVLGGLLVLAVLAGGLYGAWVWSQRQYFVGVDGDQVAIYRGLGSDLGPLELSQVDERTGPPLEALRPVDRDAVERGIGADDLADARRTVANLWSGSSECEPETVVVRPSPSSSPGPTTTAGGTATTPGAPPATTAAPTPTPTPTPSTSTLPLPDECEG
ncbi:protein phosphatase 2C domain-containing protein [Angustibacter speluncae]